MENINDLGTIQKLSVSQINSIVNGFNYRENDEELNKLLSILLSDSREGVKKAGQRLQKRNIAYKEEILRLDRMMKFEKELYLGGIKYIAGVDEAGRGPLAGPVVAAAVILPEGEYIEGVNDSKKVSVKRREELFDIIKEKALAYYVAEVSNQVIDNINILNATKLAMKNCIDNLEIKPEYVLVDAVKIPDIAIPQRGIIKGDALSVSIAAASILAKVTRDNTMNEYHKKYPQYGFNVHKGYGTKEHIAAIIEKGSCDIHRKSFIKNFI